MKAQGLEDHLVVREATIEQVPAESDSYDIVWCRDMLHHIADLGSALRECAPVVRSGGLMLIFHTVASDVLEPRGCIWLSPGDERTEDWPVPGRNGTVLEVGT